MINLKNFFYKISLLLIVVLAITSSRFLNSDKKMRENNELTNPTVPDSQYIIGAFSSGSDASYSYIKDSLKQNMWHIYTGINSGWPGIDSDKYNVDTIYYKSGVISRIDENNNEHGLRTFMNRPIIEYLVGGQRIDYQCETVGDNYNSDPYWFYAYNYSLNNQFVKDIFDNSQFGQNEKVKFCELFPEDPINGYILIDSGIRANREMSFNQTNDWMKDTAYEWYIMPRIRIDSTFAAGESHNSDTVCRIVITGWKGEVEKDIVLTVRNFKPNAVAAYSGHYMDSFYPVNNGPLDYKKLDQSQMINFMNPNVFTFEWDSLCYVDIKIYWSGKCNMWIDKVRIENRPAHEYLTLRDSTWISKVNSEVGWSMRNYNNSYPIPNYIYFEESQFSHFPSISELDKQIKQSSNNKNALIIWLNYDLFKAHIPDCWRKQLSSAMLKKYLYDDFGLTNIVMGAYGFEGWPISQSWGYSYHPETLLSTGYNSSTGVLSHSTNSSGYDNWLQTHIDNVIGGTGFNFIYRRMDTLSKTTDMKIINCPQAHLWFNSGHKLKEPSNEELELQTCLGIGYNAKGTVYFGYACTSGPIGSGSSYAAGLVNPDGSPRHNSVYGQDKFGKAVELGKKLNKWAPTVLTLDPIKTKSFIYHTERSNMISNSCFDDIYTYHPNPSNFNEKNSTVEEQQYRYLQATEFGKTGEQYTKYFMMLNRRCSPHISSSEYGGGRYFSVKFNRGNNGLKTFSSWKIIDLKNDSLIATFSTFSATPVDLGWFEPGEGKLYKMIPVMIAGGDLQAAEEIYRITFDCDSIVNSNGYDISIYTGTHISFANNAYWNINGGDFRCGLTDPENSEYVDSVFLKNKTNASWLGLRFEDCDYINITKTNFSGIGCTIDSNDIYAISVADCPVITITNNAFNCNNSLYCGAVSLTKSNSGSAINEYWIVDNNKLYMTNANVSAISANAYGSQTMPVYIRYNYFSSEENNSNGNAISINGAYGAVISHNNINDYTIGVLLSSSTAYLLNNQITSSKSGSIGINSVAGSYANLIQTEVIRRAIRILLL